MGDASNLEPTEQAAPCTCGASADEICSCIADQTAELIANADANAAAIIAAINDQSDIDVEYVCGDSGNWERVTFIDGVETARVDTGRSCEEPPPQDIEPAQECRDDELWNVWYATDPANPGEQIEVAAQPTGLPCEQGKPSCMKWQSVFVQLDNTGSSFAEENTITVESTDGSVDSFTTGPHAGWSAQVTDIAAQMDAIFSGGYDARCTTGCGGLLPPPSDAPAQPGIVARYINGVHCPTDIKIPISATVTRADGRVLDLPFFVIKGPEYRGQICRTCNGGAGELQFSDGTAVPEADLPVCTFECAEFIPEPPLSKCSFDTVGPVCEILPEVDLGTEEPPIPAQIVTTGVFLITSECEGILSTTPYVLEDDALVELDQTEGTFFGDCDTLEPVGEPIPLCPENAVFECVQIPAFGHIVDNSFWIGAPADHLNNLNATLEIEQVNGTVSQHPIDSSNPTNFLRLALQAVGFNVQNVCANWAGCTNPALEVPWGIEPEREELFGNGFFATTCDPDLEIVRLEIIASDVEGWVGAQRPVNWYVGPVEKFYKSVNCEGVFWKDCDGNDAADPGCCGDPCSAESTDLSKYEAECCDGTAGVEYVNSDNETELDISVSGAGDVIKITGGSGDGSDAEITAYIESCLAEGNSVDIEWTTTEGATGQGTIDAQSNAFPGFSGPGTFEWAEGGQAGKLSQLSASCHSGECDKALRTVGCNDDRRDEKLDTIIDLLGSVIGDCPDCDGESSSGSVVAEYSIPDAAATEQSYGIGDVNAGNPGNGIKFDTANALSAELTAAHMAIRDCIASGNVANVVITDQDGASVELNLDFDNTTEDAAGNVQQYSYEGTDLPDVDPGSGKIRAMVVSCAGDSDAQCIRTGANCKAINTHLIEGCILVDSPTGPNTVSAFTIVDDDGVPLFPPKPLTDLGFVDCCPVVGNTRPVEVVNEGGAVRG